MDLLRRWAQLTILIAIFSNAQAENSDALSLQTALDLALRNNPSLAEIKARSEAMAYIPSQVATLPDPVISFNALNLPTDSFDVGQENMTQLQAGFSQQIPFPGKLALREQTATHEAQAAAHTVVEARWLLLRDVKQAWWSLLYLDHV